MKSDSPISVLLLALCAVPVIFILESALNGWTLTILWKWFIVPSFDARPLAVPYAMGISLIIRSAVYQPPGKEERSQGLGSTIGIAIAKPFIVLALGWLITLFI